MIEFFKNLFQNNFMPHGHCYMWDPAILWSHAISDGIIALAYCSIPLSLIYIFKKRNDFKYIWMFVLFAVFIFGCGLTHVFDVINIWEPYYRIDSLIRGITAIASIGTAIMLVRVTPRLVRIPSAEQWIKVNQELENQLIQLKEKDKIIEAIQQFEDLAEAVPQIMYMVSPAGEVIYINYKWFDYTGASSSTTGVTVEKLFSPYLEERKRYEVMEDLSNYFRRSQKFEMNFRIRGKDQVLRWFLTRCIPVTSREGHQQWFGILLEIDEQIKRNEELEEKNKSLVKINNDLDNFIYTASHDLKTPISNMEGIISILKEQLPAQDSEIFNQMMTLMNRSVSRLKNTIEDITDISRIQKEKPDDVEMVSFEEIYQDIIQDLNFEIENKKLQLLADFEVKEINFSRKNMRSIIYNLVSNAVKYHNQENNGFIEIKSLVEDNNVVLTVKDNGPGIKKEHLDKIFEMFRRFNDTKGGTGIGLYIVKRIIENEGGKIFVESTEDIGTKFTVLFNNIH